MPLTLTLLLFIGLAPLSYAAEVDCHHLKNSCEFYTCIEAKRSCGRFGYAEGFGKKYCLRFKEREHHFSDLGIQWIEKTRDCLIRSFEEAVEEKSCRNVKKAAFNDHVACYLDSGFCELSKKDQKELYKVIWPSLWRYKTLKAGLQIKKLCSNRITD